MPSLVWLLELSLCAITVAVSAAEDADFVIRRRRMLGSVFCRILILHAFISASK